MKNKVFFIAIAAVVVLALAIGFGVFFLNNSSDYVAKVDGEKITVAEYKFFLANVKSSIEQAVGLSSSDASSVDSFWKGKLGTMKAEDYAKEQALGKVQEFKIQLIKAKEEEVKLEQSDISSVDTYIDTIIKNNGGKENAEKAIKQDYGITLNQLKGIYKDSKLVDKYMKTKEDAIKVTDQDVKKYFDENMEVSGKTATVWHILLMTKDSSGTAMKGAELEKVKKNAEDILSKVRSGVNFASLVTQYTEDTGSKQTGGQYTFKKGDMVKQFEDWSFKAKPGDTGIVKSDYGYHIMKKPTYAELKDSAKNGFIGKEYDNMLEKWKKDKNFNIEKNDKQYNKITIQSI